MGEGLLPKIRAYWPDKLLVLFILARSIFTLLELRNTADGLPNKSLRMTTCNVADYRQSRRIGITGR